MNTLGAVPAIILAGGLGTRLRSVVSDRPKVLAPMGDKTNLDLIADNLLRSGITKLVLSVGYLKELVREHVAHRAWPPGVTVVFSEEEEPLGTGGAIKKALAHIESERALIMNGDTFCDVPFADLLAFHTDKKGLVSIVLTPRKDLVSGGVELDANNRIVSYVENGSEALRYMNAGTYLMQKSVLSHMPETERFSIEHDFFPGAVKEGFVYGYPLESEAFDIGTPERYTRAQATLLT